MFYDIVKVKLSWFTLLNVTIARSKNVGCQKYNKSFNFIFIKEYIVD